MKFSEFQTLLDDNRTLEFYGKYFVDADGETQNFTVTLPTDCIGIGDDYHIDITALSPVVTQGHWIVSQNETQFVVRFVLAPDDTGYFRWKVTKKFVLK